MTEPCPVCLAELASVVLATDDGNVCLGPKCSRLLEAFAKLMGVTPRRRAMLREIK